MDGRTDERLLRNIESYLMELVFVVESIRSSEPDCRCIGLGSGRSSGLGPKATIYLIQEQQLVHVGPVQAAAQLDEERKAGKVIVRTLLGSKPLDCMTTPAQIGS